jgi:enediyne biosynthesis protein E5
MEKQNKDLRIGALIRFAAAITVLNLVGHFYLGIEASWAHPLVALGTTYSIELIFEYFVSKQNNFRPRYLGGFKKFILFLLPAHISGMAVSMLLFTNSGLMPIIFASAAAILSKIIFRISVNNKSVHFLNPSNTGIAITLILFPWIGIAPPYQFTENTSGMVDWILPLVFISIGSLLNTKFTKRMPLILAWFGGFALQAIIRGLIYDIPIQPLLNPFTGVAFLLFSYYMVSDPATTPSKLSNQIWFGGMVGIVYGVLVINQIVFGQFFALFLVCLGRGVLLYAKSLEMLWSENIAKKQHEKEIYVGQLIEQ